MEREYLLICNQLLKTKLENMEDISIVYSILQLKLKKIIESWKLKISIIDGTIYFFDNTEITENNVYTNYIVVFYDHVGYISKQLHVELFNNDIKKSYFAII